MKIEDMFFHGVGFADWVYVPDGFCHLNLLEMVLKDKAIFTRSHLWEKHKELYWCLNHPSCNGEDRVSISCHLNKYDQYGMNDENSRFLREYDDAFGGICL